MITMDVMEWWCGDGARGGVGERRGGRERDDGLNFQVEFFIENYM